MMVYLGDGVQWSNFHEPVNVSDNFTMIHVYTMLLIDCVLYGLICWYVEAVNPGEYGIPKKWYFPVTVRRMRVIYGGRINQFISNKRLNMWKINNL